MNLRRIWVVGCVFLALLSGVSAVHDAVNDHNYRDAVKVAATRAHFWHVVAGTEQPIGPTVDDKLASDLHELLGPNDSGADSLPDELAQFTGTSNQYGGITDAIGQDPFVSAGCGECGPLNAGMRDDLLQVKRGEVEDVISEHQPEHGASLWPIPLVLLALWLLGGLTIPIYLHYRQQQKVASQYPAEMQLVASLDNVLGELDPHHPQYDEIARLRNALETAVKTRVRAGESEIADVRISRLVEDARGTLEAFDEGNRALES